MTEAAWVDREQTLNFSGKTDIDFLNYHILKFACFLLAHPVYAIEHKLLSPAQLGFVAGNRCSDAHIIIHNLIKQKCHMENGKIFSCFVDFRKSKI